MERSNLLKILAAFVAGITVALGCALIYLRSNTVESSPVVQPQAIAHKPDVVQQQSAPSVALSASNVAAQTPLQAAQNAKVVSQRISPARKPQPRKREEVGSSNPNPVSVPATAMAQDERPSVTSEPMPPVAPVAPPAPALASAPPINEPQETAPTSPRQPRTVTLEAGTPLTIRLGETLSTDRNTSGDTFPGTLESPIIRDGYIIADRGSKVLGRISNAQKAGRVKGVSDLALVLTEINTTDGQRVAIDTTPFEKRADRHARADTAKVAGGAAIGAIIGAIAGGGKGAAIGAGVGGAAGTGTVLATRGEAAIVPIETQLTFRLANPVSITEKLNN